MSFLKNTLLLIKSVYIISVEYVKYKLNYNNEIETFNNITTRLSNLNILYTKFLQWIINDTIYDNEDIKKSLEKFTDNVEYQDSDIDYMSLLQLLNNSNIKLQSFKPYKSGTISLVFKGTLDDKPIVIKMVKKDIQKKLVESIDFFKLLGRISQYIPYLNKFNIYSLINDNSKELLLQTNFVKEVENIELFNNKFKYNSNVIIPKVYNTYTLENNNLIVMDFIEGTSVYSILHEDKEAFIRILYLFIFECLFNNDVFHGDLHPGNILFIKDNENEKNKYKIGIIDYGIISMIGPAIKPNICIFFKKLAQKKYRELFTLVIDYLVEPLSTKTLDKQKNISKDIIIDDLVKTQIECSILKSSLKANDIYHINRILEKYYLILSSEFSKLFLCVSSMYSLLFILQHEKEDGLFESAFDEYCNKNFFNYLYFAD
jgi:predicted unusual protein kinase regulating ubiquinone biosynthesis (AarF/ABC1/UbiB family)